MDPLSGPSLRQIVEAILFASNTPVTLKALREVVGEDDAPYLPEALEELRRDYEEARRGVFLAEMGGGYQILSREECAEHVERYLKVRRRARLSRAALETLAIIAYRQPVTKVEIDRIRGVDSAGVVGTLLERRLVVIRGRAKAVGSPLLYGTTMEFLTTFGLNRLDDLPRLEEIESLVSERDREILVAAREALESDQEAGGGEEFSAPDREVAGEPPAGAAAETGPDPATGEP